MIFFFFFSGERKYVNTKLLVFLSDGEMYEENLKLRSSHGIFIFHVEYSSRFCQQTEIASRLPFGLYCMTCSLLLLSF